MQPRRSRPAHRGAPPGRGAGAAGRCSARNPELLRSPEATRAGDLLVHPLARQLYRAAAEQVAEAGSLDVPAWLETARRPSAPTIASALMDDDRFAKLADPAGYLRKLVIRLEILRVDAEIAMNTRLQKEAQARGDEAPAMRALAGVASSFDKTKEGLKTALQRP